MDEYKQLPQEETDEAVETRRPGADLYEWLQMFLGCVVAAVVLFNCVARLTRVDGGSMDNTLEDGEIMLIWSLGYTPAQGDIVVLNKTPVLPGHCQAGHRHRRPDGGYRLQPERRLCGRPASG